MVSTNVDERVLLGDLSLVSNPINHMAALCTNLGKVWSPGTSKVDVDQVGLCPEGSKAEALHLLPPSKESGESGILLGDCKTVLAPSQRRREKKLTFFTFTRMQLDLQLTDWQGFTRKIISGPSGSEVHGGFRGRRWTGLSLEEVEEGFQGSKLCAFDVDFEDIDEIMTVVFHEPAETPHLDVHVGTVVISGTKCPRLEMSSVTVGIEFRAPLKVVVGERCSGIEDLES